MTEEDKQLLSAIATDLLTGNHLLGRKRSDDHKSLMEEFCIASYNVNNNKELSDREKDIMIEMGKIFYEGIPDMCEQLHIDYNNLKKLLY